MTDIILVIIQVMPNCCDCIQNYYTLDSDVFFSLSHFEENFHFLNSIYNNFIILFSASVRKHVQFEKVTDYEVEAVIKKWLVYAKDREGGRAHHTVSKTAD